jgi:hypothetical protein
VSIGEDEEDPEEVSGGEAGDGRMSVAGCEPGR